MLSLALFLSLLCFVVVIQTKRVLPFSIYRDFGKTYYEIFKRIKISSTLHFISSMFFYSFIFLFFEKRCITYTLQTVGIFFNFKVHLSTFYIDFNSIVLVLKKKYY